ncbi:glucose-methanol-choline oxidoreductase, partial [Mycena capillaripes]
SKTMQFYISKPSDHLGDKSTVVTSGHCVGGGPSVNFMMYNWPAASDFDEWEKNFGNVGWSAKDLLPMLEKVSSRNLRNRPAQSTHGSDGPLRISFG